jgi:hypothetical protein
MTALCKSESVSGNELCQSACRISVHDQVANLFYRYRYNLSALQKRTNRNQALAAWEEVSCANTSGIQAACSLKRKTEIKINFAHALQVDSTCSIKQSVSASK